MLSTFIVSCKWNAELAHSMFFIVNLLAILCIQLVTEQILRKVLEITVLVNDFGGKFLFTMNMSDFLNLCIIWKFYPASAYLWQKDMYLIVFLFIIHQKSIPCSCVFL